MPDFSHLNKLAITALSTMRYPLIELEGSPVLILRPANESNAAYFNALLKANAHAGVRRKKQKIDGKLTAEIREQDRELYPKHVIAGWEAVVDSDGKDVPFSMEAAVEFLAALPNWIFDGVRTSALDPENFIGNMNVEEQAGN
jgi:hypothetical protein